MTGETNIKKLISGMSPERNDGEYVFVTLENPNFIDRKLTLGEFKEKEGVTVIIEKDEADKRELSYDYIAVWITLKVHSSLHAVGLTAAFSSALGQHDVSCNVVAGYYHDHIFVDTKDAEKAMRILSELGENHE